LNIHILFSCTYNIGLGKESKVSQEKLDLLLNQFFASRQTKEFKNAFFLSPEGLKPQGELDGPSIAARTKDNKRVKPFDEDYNQVKQVDKEKEVKKETKEKKKAEKKKEKKEKAKKEKAKKDKVEDVKVKKEGQKKKLDRNVGHSTEEFFEDFPTLKRKHNDMYAIFSISSLITIIAIITLIPYIFQKISSESL
jgi:hypothetical protein